MHILNNLQIYYNFFVIINTIPTQVVIVSFFKKNIFVAFDKSSLLFVLDNDEYVYYNYFVLNGRMFPSYTSSVNRTYLPITKTYLKTHF